MGFLVSAIITAAGKNTRMLEDQNKKNLLIKNKLLLDIQGKPVILNTVNRVLNSEVDDCIIVLGHFKEEIVVVLNDLDDNRIKIVENNRFDVPLSQSLLNGVKNSKGDICLCVAGDQPTVTTKTFCKLVNNVISFENPENIVCVLSRGKTGYIDSAEGLGMPFACHRTLLEKYLPDYSGNINPVLRKMIKDGVVFYGLECENELELVNINRMVDYEIILRDFKD
ncbi:MAG: NTP transferase domain-containing protein [Methanobacteriaceae archaeon]|jgi:molybdenum cofactor cytidylyltransferase|nr:NTP transferase domain-containing protein [Methanobacteriaceae archaeon]MDO9626131.1 NTP transferase domain-containing protein [Methanobacteriaceae archaeon]